MALNELKKKQSNLMNQDKKVPDSGLPNAGKTSGPLPGTKGVRKMESGSRNAPLDREAEGSSKKNESQYEKVNDMVLQGGKDPGRGSGV